jgi:hypothetical protein
MYVCMVMLEPHRSTGVVSVPATAAYILHALALALCHVA